MKQKDKFSMRTYGRVKFEDVMAQRLKQSQEKCEYVKILRH